MWSDSSDNVVSDAAEFFPVSAYLARRLGDVYKSLVSSIIDETTETKTTLILCQPCE